MSFHAVGPEVLKERGPEPVVQARCMTYWQLPAVIVHRKSKIINKHRQAGTSPPTFTVNK